MLQQQRALFQDLDRITVHQQRDGHTALSFHTSPAALAPPGGSRKWSYGPHQESGDRVAFFIVVHTSIVVSVGGVWPPESALAAQYRCSQGSHASWKVL